MGAHAVTIAQRLRAPRGTQGADLLLGILAAPREDST